MTLPLLLLAASCAGAQPPVAAAGSVVRSKEWVIRRGKKREEEFKGDVRYESAGARLDADWALYRHATRDWRARGGVRLRKTLKGGDEIEARGESARHDEKTQEGALDPAPGGRVDLVRTPLEGGPDRGEAGRLSWKGEETVTLSNGARVWGPRLELLADSARYERPERRLVLEGGRPVLRKVSGEWTTALKADRIVAAEVPRRVEAMGSVRGWLIFKDPAKLKEPAK
ncbi:MAG TPA: hypothetical protein DCZ01_13390 [Elusimicrobia bacterium]|nr:MAG: hypothetical protein A2X37_11630 [Elusimicrobia bacterium GWA2_66_18]OGR74100.1 MAG: hypothetical protein A2X40_02975 [Elusimicrobia bacterium GWC2_65_9]HAZ09476.1 hypothetical protein [Elusimicrobiota bacterium]